MFFLKHPLAGIPTIGFVDRLVGGYRVFVVCDPVNRGEKFHSERCFKTGNEIDNPLKMACGWKDDFQETSPPVEELREAD